MTQGNQGNNCFKWVETWARLKWWVLSFGLPSTVQSCSWLWCLLLVLQLLCCWMRTHFFIPFPYINWIGFVGASMFQLVYCNSGSIVGVWFNINNSFITWWLQLSLDWQPLQWLRFCFSCPEFLGCQCLQHFHSPFSDQRVVLLAVFVVSRWGKTETGWYMRSGHPLGKPVEIVKVTLPWLVQLYGC